MGLHCSDGGRSEAARVITASYVQNQYARLSGCTAGARDAKTEGVPFSHKLAQILESNVSADFFWGIITDFGYNS